MATVLMSVWRAGAAGALAAALLAGCNQGAGPGTSGGTMTAGCAFKTSPPATEIDGTPQPANQEELDDLAQRIIPLVEEPFDDVYAGIAMEQERNRVVIYRVPSNELDRLIREQFQDECVELRDAQHSAVQLRGLQQRIEADQRYWRGRGIGINTTGARGDGSGVEVGVDAGDVAQAQAELPKWYGTSPAIVVVEAGPVSW